MMSQGDLPLVFMSQKLPRGNRVEEMLNLILILRRLEINLPKDLLKLIFEELKIVKCLNKVLFTERRQDYQLSESQKNCDFVRINKKVRDYIYFNEFYIMVKEEDNVLIPIMLMSHLDVAFEIYPEESLEFYSFKDPEHPLKKVIYDSNIGEIYYFNGKMCLSNIANNSYNGCKAHISALTELNKNTFTIEQISMRGSNLEVLVNAGYLTLENPWIKSVDL